MSSLLGDRGVSNTVRGRAEVIHASLHWVTTFDALGSSLCHMFLCAIACQGVTCPFKGNGKYLGSCNPGEQGLCKEVSHREGVMAA